APCLQRIDLAAAFDRVGPVQHVRLARGRNARAAGFDDINAAQETLARDRIGHITKADRAGPAHEGTFEAARRIAVFRDVEFTVAEEAAIADFIDCHSRPYFQTARDDAGRSGARRQNDAAESSAAA